MLPSLPKDDIIKPPPTGFAFLFVFCDVVLVCVDSSKLLSKAYELSQSCPKLPSHAYFLPVQTKWAPRCSLNSLVLVLCLQTYFLCLLSNVTSSMKPFPMWLGRVNHTQLGGDRVTWVPNLTPSTHDLDNLLDFSKSQFPCLFQKQGCDNNTYITGLLSSLYI